MITTLKKNVNQNNKETHCTKSLMFTVQIFSYKITIPCEIKEIFQGNY